jgi:hypothetical protein
MKGNKHSWLPKQYGLLHMAPYAADGTPGALNVEAI